MSSRRPGAAWGIAALVCLAGGAVLLLVAWYDISGTANVYQQLPYLVSAGFSGLGLIIVGSALLIADRGDRVERRLSRLIDALTEVRQAAPPGAADAALPTEPATGQHPAPPVDIDLLGEAALPLLVAPGGATYHRPGCLLLRDKAAAPAPPAEITAGALIPCPVCDPAAPGEPSSGAKPASGEKLS